MFGPDSKHGSHLFHSSSFFSLLSFLFLLSTLISLVLSFFVSLSPSRYSFFSFPLEDVRKKNGQSWRERGKEKRKKRRKIGRKKEKR